MWLATKHGLYSNLNWVQMQISHLHFTQEKCRGWIHIYHKKNVDDGVDLCFAPKIWMMSASPYFAQESTLNRIMEG